jgi:hypothetical protein
MEFQIQSRKGDPRPLIVRHPAVTMAGYTGRNRELVLAHIEELARHGIPAPASVPAYYRVPWQLLSHSEEPVEVGGPETSGEVEPVLLITESGSFVTVGSDHTDRAAERASIELSKRLAPKIIARQVWPLEEVKDHWDDLALRSWVNDSTLYQQGTAGRILALGEFPLAQLRPPGRDLVLFLGTLPLLTGGFVMGGRFKGEIADPILGRSIELSYAVKLLRDEGDPK